MPLRPPAVVSVAAAVEAPAARPDRRARAVEIVRCHVLLAIGAGLIPLPYLDLAAIGALQLKVLAALARHYEVPFAQAEAEAIVSAVLGSVGSTLVAGGALGTVAKFIPGVGTVTGLATLAVAGGSITYAFGQLAVGHFEAGGHDGRL